MKTVPERDRISLLPVFAFRSMAYQRQIIERKLAVGQNGTDSSSERSLSATASIILAK
jgi:hypothetical protein